MFESISERDEQGQTMAEYVVMLSVLTIVTFATISLAGTSVLALFQRTLEAVADIT